MQTQLPLEPVNVIALSGGKDSTAMTLRLAEVEPSLVAKARIICSPTGDELPEVLDHWTKLERILGRPIERITNAGRTLHDWIDHFNALPNPRMRWCTRLLKAQPAVAFVAMLAPGSTMFVGLRADEPTREGIYSEGLTSRFPLREWNWGVEEVVEYLRRRGISIPKRTDCARCPYQRLGEWHALWLNHPEIYEHAAAQEDRIGHTFRSPSRDTWSADLRGLAAEFASGRVIRGGWSNEPGPRACRLCSL